MTGTENKKTLQKEAEFWDRQEEVIQELYDRPHDWRFVPVLANRIVRAREKWMRRLVMKRRQEIGRVLDIGCGSGWFVHACAELGIQGIGVDVSGKKIETASKAAQERGLADLCTFEAIDVMDLDIEHHGGKVDMLFAQGSLHHLPGLKEKLPLLVEKLLRPGGYMLFCEPHYEGMAPGLQKFIWRLANSRLFGRLFDHEFFAEVTKNQGQGQDQESAGSAPGKSSPDDYNLRAESPAGLEFLGEEPEMAKIVREAGSYQLLEERFFHAFAGHLTNAFYIYMKSRAVKVLFRMVFPLLVGMDNFLCRYQRFRKHAEEGAWFLRAPDGGGDTTAA
ncbi:MAG: class I SAM-dependent methyltransferase [Planctomycetota bacterium]|jgi:2-polyprenyl-3-methyl-5-hydroxy-6-metoxy-1,4-benzoquinol methylase